MTSLSFQTAEQKNEAEYNYSMYALKTCFRCKSKIHMIFESRFSFCCKDQKTVIVYKSEKLKFS